MLASLISFALRKRPPVVVIAPCLLIGAAGRKDKPLNVIPEFSPLSLTVRTEAFGLSSAEVQSLIPAPLEAAPLKGIPWLQWIQSAPPVVLSTIKMTFLARHQLDAAPQWETPFSAAVSMSQQGSADR